MCMPPKEEEEVDGGRCNGHGGRWRRWRPQPGKQAVLQRRESQKAERRTGTDWLADSFEIAYVLYRVTLVV